MSSAEELERRLASHRDLRSIVKTMRALSAASIRQYEHAVNALADYHRTVELGLRAIMGGAEPPATPVWPAGGGLTVVVVLGSDHGLCGRVNEDVALHALAGDDIRPLAGGVRPTAGGVRPAAGGVRPTAGGGELAIIAVGARMPPLLESGGLTARACIDAPASAARIKTVVQDVLLTVDAWRARSGLASLSVVHAQHGSGTAYRPLRQPLFPVDPSRFSVQREQRWPGRSRPVFSLPGEVLLGALVRELLFVSLFRACAESQASEHASRLGAMSAALRNLDERIEEVTCAYRRVRQGAITAELLDVVAGYEALGAAARPA